MLKSHRAGEIFFFPNGHLQSGMATVEATGHPLTFDKIGNLTATVNVLSNINTGRVFNEV